MILFSALWLAAVWAAPVAASRGWAAAPLLYAFFDPVCHQIAERSFHLGPEPLAVCHRCTGLYVGFALGLLAAPFFGSARRWLLEEPKRILLFFLPLALDWIWIGNTASTRFSTGLLAAMPIAVLLWAANRQIFRIPNPTPIKGEI